MGYGRFRTTFVLPARFEHQGDDWIQNAWSLVVETLSPANPSGTQAAQIHFLMEDAPSDWLASGERFSLFEGNLWLADGVIE
jgi:hypothetical protein